MSKITKSLIILLTGAVVLVFVGAVTGYWKELFIFAGPVILLAFFIGALVGEKKKQREVGGGIVFWSGIAALFIQVIIHTVMKAAYPEHWEVMVTCFVEGSGLSMLIYYLKVKTKMSPLTARRDVLPRQL